MSSIINRSLYGISLSLCLSCSSTYISLSHPNCCRHSVLIWILGHNFCHENDVDVKNCVINVTYYRSIFEHKMCNHPESGETLGYTLIRSLSKFHLERFGDVVR